MLLWACGTSLLLNLSSIGQTVSGGFGRTVYSRLKAVHFLHEKKEKYADFWVFIELIIVFDPIFLDIFLKKLDKIHRLNFDFPTFLRNCLNTVLVKVFFLSEAAITLTNFVTKTKYFHYYLVRFLLRYY